MSDADIIALTLHLPAQTTHEAALSAPYEHVRRVADGKTGLAYFDDWTASNDSEFSAPMLPTVWSLSHQAAIRVLLAQGYRVTKTEPSATGETGVLVSILVR